MTTAPVTADVSRHLGWMTEGHRFFMAALAQVSDDELDASSALPGWTGRHILSHVGHNARAVGRLASWAATGIPTPMYSGPAARAAEIALGAGWDAQRLRSFVEVEQQALAAALAKLDDEQWATEVVTAQGRHVLAAALPWLRTRELWIHATDLSDDVDFSDFPAPLLDELIADVLRWRRDAKGEVVPAMPTGRTADLARWLTGRSAAFLRSSDGSPLSALGPWL